MSISARYIFGLTLFAMVGLSHTAFAQDDPAKWAAYIQSNCGKEITANCKGIAMGQGRILACLYSRENKLSAKCGGAVMASLERLGTALGALANVMRVCESDAKRLCNGVVAGNGNLVGCLSQSKGSVSAQCNGTLDAAFLRP
jgi:hypothetical protein